jgi:hypothetical protein
VLELDEELTTVRVALWSPAAAINPDGAFCKLLEISGKVTLVRTDLPSNVGPPAVAIWAGAVPNVAAAGAATVPEAPVRKVKLGLGDDGVFDVAVAGLAPPPPPLHPARDVAAAKAQPSAAAGRILVSVRVLRMQSPVFDRARMRPDRHSSVTPRRDLPSQQRQTDAARRKKQRKAARARPPQP